MMPRLRQRSLTLVVAPVPRLPLVPELGRLVVSPAPRLLLVPVLGVMLRALELPPSLLQVRRAPVLEHRTEDQSGPALWLVQMRASVVQLAVCSAWPPHAH